ncbi:MAG: hypothetical protein QOK44_5405, partial [Betaproteobacteria bacterium]|nr:hypothetical protein [Betaproteobacteria bacterium]
MKVVVDRPLSGTIGPTPGDRGPGVTYQNKPGLLIVDDDPLITDTLDFVLSRDFSVYVAESRGQVKSLLRQLDAPPQLALIDLGLPP